MYFVRVYLPWIKFVCFFGTVLFHTVIIFLHIFLLISLALYHKLYKDYYMDFINVTFHKNILEGYYSSKTFVGK